jgi:hypothetical protein
MSPWHSDNLTEVVESSGERFVVLRSPQTAAHDPDYSEVGSFSSHAEAEAFLSTKRTACS